jgi:hypothetical protein
VMTITDSHITYRTLLPHGRILGSGPALSRTCSSDTGSRIPATANQDGEFFKLKGLTLQNLKKWEAMAVVSFSPVCKDSIFKFSFSVILSQNVIYTFYYTASSAADSQIHCVDKHAGIEPRGYRFGFEVSRL